MSETSKIEWTDATWNVVTGCEKVSPGCDNCYAETFAERWRGIPGHHFETGFDVTLRPERMMLPLKWRKPKRIFANSMSDLFHKDVPDAYIAEVFSVMARTPQHTYQVLTKRHGRMRSLLSRPSFRDSLAHLADWPLSNVWLGVSVEDQKRADLRIPALVDTPAAVRFLSCEPLLGPVWISDHIWQECPCCEGEGHDEACARCADNHCDSGHIRKLHWVIVGGESGRGARPMAPQWATSIRDQCKQHHVPFLFKQWGEYAPTGYLVIGGTSKGVLLAGDPVDDLGHRVELARVGKKKAGRELDGRTWDEFPASAA
ncbi:MAG: phage Gp37/Gp68 family protein [Streptomyces sp.]|nr:phage Gp37/Gp68 family protein [Streptomyces sp.]